MAGLWESKSGVFWSTPPVVPEPALSLSTEIMIGVLLALTVTALLKHFSLNYWPKQWRVRNHLGAIGTALTLSYLAVVLPLIGGRVESLMTMPLNEVGDFLAGAFGPVAFMWLVLGFLQQGEELRQGTEALLLQATELKNSVEQQSIMAAAAAHQLAEAERVHEANFSVYTVGTIMQPNGLVHNVLRIVNNGKDATDMLVHFDPPFPASKRIEVSELRSGAHVDCKLHFDLDESPGDGVARIDYRDFVGGRREAFFSFVLNRAERKVALKKMRAEDV